MFLDYCLQIEKAGNWQPMIACINIDSATKILQKYQNLYRGARFRVIKRMGIVVLA